MINRILLGFCCLFLFACNPSKKIKSISPTPTPEVEAPYQFPYSINQPNQSFKLPKILEEISGLGFCPNDKSLCAIQDENGLYFKINTTNGKVTTEKKFYKDGDYEGIEMVGDKTYIVKSTGTIYEVTDLEKETPTVNKYKSFLNKKHNVEGLAYDSETNHLVLACKGHAADTDSTKKARSFYYFNLDTKEMRGEPLFYFHKEQVMKFIETSVPEENRHLFKVMDPGADEFKLGPSGIAIHPITKNYYVISSKSKVLIVCNQKGELVHFEKLDKKVHFQPEGIVFEPSGTLYISTEADKQEAAFIYKFEMNSKN